jgi:hypothetical protein
LAGPSANTRIDPQYELTWLFDGRPPKRAHSKKKRAKQNKDSPLAHTAAYLSKFHAKKQKAKKGHSMDLNEDICLFR